MPDEQYSIGGFAAVNKITPRMLRHYDKIGLLKPAAVLENGYRAYTSDQIETISGIRAYRVAVPVKAPLIFEGYECIAMEAGWYLSTMHYGDYYSIGMAYDRLIRYAGEKEYTLKQPFLERHLLDAESAASPSQYQTQIFVQLTP